MSPASTYGGEADLTAARIERNTTHCRTSVRAENVSNGGASARLRLTRGGSLKHLSRSAGWCPPWTALGRGRPLPQAESAGLNPCVGFV